MNMVIGIAGPTGSGKSSLARGLVERLCGALVNGDDFQTTTNWPAERVRGWLADGAPFEALDLSLLTDALSRLKQGQPVVNPATGQTISPAPHIVFETHFGRAHSASGALIDFLIWIDTPLEVSLARKCRQFAQGARTDPARGLGWLEGWL